MCFSCSLSGEVDFVEGWRRSEKSEEFSGGVDSPCSVCSACTENSYGGVDSPCSPCSRVQRNSYGGGFSTCSSCSHVQRNSYGGGFSTCSSCSRVQRIAMGGCICRVHRVHVYRERKRSPGNRQPLLIFFCFSPQADRSLISG